MKARGALTRVATLLPPVTGALAAPTESAPQTVPLRLILW